MNHDELLAKIGYNTSPMKQMDALRAVVELHKPYQEFLNLKWVCGECTAISLTQELYPCPTIQAIEKELK